MSGSVVDLFRYGGASRAVALMSACAPVEMPGGLVRMGGPGDGGYLVPRDMQGIGAVFSPGVAQAAGFEREFADRGVPCFMADKSVDGPPFAHPNFHFLKKHLGLVTDDDTITLAEWVHHADVPDGDLLLQMDIEGAEHDVIPGCPSALLGRFRVIVIEIHRLGRLARPFVHRRVAATLQKLLEQHVVVHLHPNNALPPRRWCSLRVHPVIEFTFVRRDCVPRSGRVRSLPHPLDAPNVPGRPEWPLDPAWLTDRTVKGTSASESMVMGGRCSVARPRLTRWWRLTALRPPGIDGNCESIFSLCADPPRVRPRIGTFRGSEC